MDVSEIFESLNEPQRQAVTSDSQNLLVLAGAGSGKTRVIAHRVAWLIKANGVNPHSILTVTFTNNFTDAFWIGGVYQNGANDTGSGSWNVSQSGYVARTSSSVQQTSFTGSALVDSGHVDIQNFGTLL